MKSAHVLQLTRKHRELDAQIHDEQRRPEADAAALQAMKRRKLRLKEQIAEAQGAA
ncbi:YdcH family protein [Phenylobacterium sp.]|uniref:YdcH family protein n=1 Tax=Phenylobacterium sp. TaxID=1871053 RepID=UPI0025F0A59F|nr:YdcH family protein [Phenylobacterium sp.]